MRKALLSLISLVLISACGMQDEGLSGLSSLEAAVDFNFISGQSENNLLEAKVSNNGSIVLGTHQTYTDATTPAIGSGVVRGSVMDEANGLLYVGMFSGDGIYVIDTQGTSDASDDTLLRVYNAGSTPAIGTGGITGMDFDSTTGFLWVSVYDDGLYVIDTGNNKIAGDDTIHFLYSTGSTPALSDNRPYGFHRGSDGLLVVAGYQVGVTLINTQNTVSAADDVQVAVYSQATAPVTISHQRSLDVHYDVTGSAVYVANFGGLDVIDLAGTPFTPGDDTLAGTYNTSSSPSISWDAAYRLGFDDARGLLIATGSDVVVIDTNSTATMADDTSYVRYTATELGQFGWGGSGVFYDASTTTIYWGAGGVTSINMNGTATKADDVITVVGEHDMLQPGVQQLPYYSSSLDMIFAPTWSGMMLLNSRNTLTGSYLTAPYYGKGILDNLRVAFSTTEPSGTSIGFEGRSAKMSFEDDFGDGITANVTDLYGWGSEFPSITESDGTITFTGIPGGGTWAASWVDTGAPAETYPAGTSVEIRLRTNTDAVDFYVEICIDGYDGDSVWTEDTDGEWKILSMTTQDSFNSLCVYPYWTSGWLATDYIEIDYIRVTQPSDWSAWVPLSQYGDISGAFDTTDDYVQIKADLTSDTAGKTPSVDKIILFE